MMEGDADRNRSLGREFLTWLWFKSEERGGSVSVPGVGDVTLFFQKRLVLESGEGEYTETVLCRGFYTDLKEGKAALREGKKVREARICIGIGTHEWEFTFKGDEFQFQSLRMPKTAPLGADTEDMEGRILERISLLEAPVNVMERLFRLFLETRLDPAWGSRDLPAMRDWIGS